MNLQTVMDSFNELVLNQFEFECNQYQRQHLSLIPFPVYDPCHFSIILLLPFLFSVSPCSPSPFSFLSLCFCPFVFPFIFSFLLVLVCLCLLLSLFSLFFVQCSDPKSRVEIVAHSMRHSL